MDRVLLTVNQFCKKHPFMTKGGLRFQIFDAHRNGIEREKAIVRIGRKVLIDEAKYFSWIDSQQGKWGGR